MKEKKWIFFPNVYSQWGFWFGFFFFGRGEVVFIVVFFLNGNADFSNWDIFCAVVLLQWLVKLTGEYMCPSYSFQNLVQFYWL